MELSDSTKVTVIGHRVEERYQALIHRGLSSLDNETTFLENLKLVLEADTPPAEDPVKITAKALEYIQHEQFKKDMSILGWTVLVATLGTAIVGLLMYIF